MRIYKFLLSIIAVIIGIFVTFGSPSLVRAESSSENVTASFSNNVKNTDNYQTTIKFQLSNSGSQLILYSPDYSDIDLDYLKNELGKENVISNSNSKYVIVNLQNELKSDLSGSFDVQMKKATSDILVVRDMSNNDLVNEDLVTGKPVNLSYNDTAKVSSTVNKSTTVNSALPTTDTTATSNSSPIQAFSASLPVQNALGTATTTSSDATITVDQSSYDAVNGQDLAVTGTWKSTSNNITLYYNLKTSGNTGWIEIGKYYGTANVANKFTWIIPASLMFGINGQPGGPLIVRLSANATGDGANSTKFTLNIPKIIENFKIVAPKADTSESDPYIARTTVFTLTATYNANIAGSLYLIIDGKSKLLLSTALSVSSSISSKVDMNSLGSYDDNAIHKATFEFAGSDGHYSSGDFYFVMGNKLKLDAPATINFGAHKPNGEASDSNFTATPTLNGSLTLFDGRTGNYSGPLKISANATDFKDDSGDTLDGDLYWNSSRLNSTTPVEVGEMPAPTVAEASYKNFDQDILDNMRLKMNLSTSKPGTYTSTVTWNVIDSLQ